MHETPQPTLLSNEWNPSAHYVTLNTQENTYTRPITLNTQENTRKAP